MSLAQGDDLQRTNRASLPADCYALPSLTTKQAITLISLLAVMCYGSPLLAAVIIPLSFVYRWDMFVVAATYLEHVSLVIVWVLRQGKNLYAHIFRRCIYM